MKTLRIAIMVLGIVAAGCSDDGVWQTRNVSGVLPHLAFELTSATGETVTEEDFSGVTSVVFFGYTNCPDVCPVTLAKLRAAIDRLPAPARDDVAVLFVSVDPGRDTPEVLRRYVGAFGPRFTGLTGSMAELRAMTRRFRATFSYGQPKTGDYVVSHPAAAYVFGPGGDARLLIQAEDPAEAISHDLQALLRRDV